MKKIKTAFIAMALMVAATMSADDNFELYSKLLSPEKLYLHTDREVYCVGDTLWFKGYLTNASAISEFPECNYIYVEIISAMAEKNAVSNRNEDRQDIRERVKVKRTDGMFTGFIKIPENLNTGIATLRAYSYWMLNKEPEYMFYKNLEVRNPMKDDVVRQMVEQEVRDDKKYADMGVENPFARKRTEKHDVDVQFLPESGRYVGGQPARFGIRAVSQDGLGTEVKGLIYADDRLLSEFSTDRYGMASVSVVVPAGTRKVQAQVTDDKGLDKMVPLPSPEPSAVVITVDPKESAAEVFVARYGISLPDSSFVVVHDGTEMFMRIPYSPKNSRMKIPYNLLAEGINNVAVVDGDGNVYAERAFFVYPDKPLTDRIVENKEEYGPREKVSCKVAAPDGDYSVSVSDDSYSPYSGKGYNIVSHYYLGSELMSFVENSQRLFDEQIPVAERIREMDMVMLTHGWKYYELPKILKGENMMPQFGKEYTQSISGVVKGSFATARRSMVSFVAPSIGYTAIGQLDTSGFFALNGLDFPEGTKFLVAAMSLGGSTRRFTPYLDEDIFAKFHIYPEYQNKAAYDNQYKFEAMSEYYQAGGEMVYTLNPSYVTGSRVKKDVNISPFPEYSFKDGQYRSESELAPYAEYDVMTYIVTTCPPLRFGDMVVSFDGDTTDTQTGARTIMCRTQRVSSQFSLTSGWEEIIVFLNGMRSSCADLEGINVSDLEGFAYIKGNDAVQFNTDVDNALAPRSVVMIKTKMLVHDAAKNVNEGQPLGWQRPKKFYNPVYESSTARRRSEKMRSTLYWEPALASDNGEISFDFYTSDHKVPYTIVLEGMTSDGRPFFTKEKVYR